MTGPLLSVRDLAVAYTGRTGEVRALDGAELTVNAGEFVAVVGDSGSGKSTIARAVLGLLPRAGRIVGGSVTFDGRELSTMDDRALRLVRGREIGLVPQDPAAALNPVVPIGVQVAETLHIHGLTTRRDAPRRAIELLDTAGLPDAARWTKAYPHEFSGGMRQRVLIAIALAGNPKLIIADEPTSALDVTVQAQILDHLTKLARESGTAVVLITHDFAVAADRAERLVVLSEGRSVEQGPVARVLAEPEHPRTRHLLASVPSFHAERLRPASGTVRADGPLLEVQELRKEFGSARHRTTALDGVSFTLARGETLALVGESAAGKSTAARLVVRLGEPTSGRILFDGTDLTALRGAELRRFRRRVQLVFQDPFSCLDPRFTARELIVEPLRAFGFDDRAARVREVADQVGLPGSLLDRRPAELSVGECQRVAIARAVAAGPELLVCDEPASSLDVSIQAQVLRLLVDLQGELGLSYLFIAHDLAVVRQVADRIAVLRAGRIVETGPAEQVLDDPAEPYTKTLLAAVPGGTPTERT